MDIQLDCYISSTTDIYLNEQDLFQTLQMWITLKKERPLVFNEEEVRGGKEEVILIVKESDFSFKSSILQRYIILLIFKSKIKSHYIHSQGLSGKYPIM